MMFKDFQADPGHALQIRGKKLFHSLDRFYEIPLFLFLVLYLRIFHPKAKTYKRERQIIIENLTISMALFFIKL